MAGKGKGHIEHALMHLVLYSLGKLDARVVKHRVRLVVLRNERNEDGSELTCTREEEVPLKGHRRRVRCDGGQDSELLQPTLRYFLVCARTCV